MAAKPFIVTITGLSGAVESGGLLYSFVRSTSTPRPLYTDVGLSVPAENPVEADALGLIAVYFNDALEYTWRAKTADDATTLFEADVIGGVLTLTYINPDYSEHPIIEASWVPALGAPLGSGWQAALAQDIDEILDDAKGIRICATYAEMTALTADDLTDGCVIYTKARAAAGDGGAGQWRWAAGDATSANGGTVLAHDSISGRFIRLYSPGHAATAWFPATDAGMTAASAAAGAGGSVELNSAVTISATWSGGSGQTLRVNGGTIAPPASTATFTWNGKIEAPPDRQIFTGANIARVRVSNKCEAVWHEWFGAIGDGATNDYTAIAATFAAIPSDGSVPVRLRGVAYATETKITIGDGTSSVRSTVNGITIIGSCNPGASAGDVSSAIMSSYKWTGTNSTASIIMQVDGPIYGHNIQNVILDCNNRAGVGLVDNHLYRCTRIGVYIDNVKPGGSQFAWQLAARDTGSFTGWTQGFFENRYEDFGVKPLAGGQVNCMSMVGGKTNNAGFSRNIFCRGQLLRGDTSSSISLQVDFWDNNTVERVFCVSIANPVTTGYALRRLTQASGTYAGLFPNSNRFIGCNLVGTIATADDTTFSNSTTGGTDIMLGAGTSDGEPDVTNLPYGFKAIYDNGVIGPGFAGSQLHLAGYATGSLSTSATEYFFPAAPSAGGVDNFVVWIAPKAGRLRHFATFNSVVPGGAASRTFTVEIGGVATALSNVYGAAESGRKTDTGTVSVAEGDRIQIASEMSGTPAASNLHYSIVFEPTVVA